MKTNINAVSKSKSLLEDLSNYLDLYGGFGNKNDSINPPETHLVHGINIQLDAKQINQVYNQEDSFTIHGNGKNNIDLSKLNISKNSRIIIFAHGAHSDSKHQIQLYSPLYSNEVDYTMYSFQAITKASKEQPVNVELLSCHGGYAIYDIAHLPKNSSLMTFVDGNNIMWTQECLRVIKGSANFINPENQFIRFASYILLRLDDNSFAINYNEKNHYFFSKISTIEDYSLEGIRAWQKKTVNEFAKFVKHIDFSGENENKAKDFLNLVNNETELTKWLNSFDTKHYNQSLLSSLNTQSLQTIEKILSYEFNASSLFAPLYAAAYLGHSEIVHPLVKNGANINQATYTSKDTPLHVAIKYNKLEVVEKLVELGADINVQNKNGDTVLQLAAIKGHMQAIAGSLIKNKTNKDIIDLLSKYLRQDCIKVDNAHWNLVEEITKKIPKKDRIEIVSEVLETINNTSRRDRLLSFLPENERALASAKVAPTIWQEVREKIELMHCNSSVEVPLRGNKVKEVVSGVSTNSKKQALH